MPEASSVFFVGDVAEDRYFTADRWPGPGDKAFVRTMRSHVGGMIANAASVFAGLGGRPEFVSMLNNGPHAERLCAALSARGVSTRHMLRSPAMGDPSNLIFLVNGENVVLTVDHDQTPMVLPPETVAALRAPGHLYITLHRARRLVAGSLAGSPLLASLRAHGRRAVFDLDVDGFAPADEPFLEEAAALLMNRHGFDTAFGTRDVNAWMRAHGIGLVVRTLGAEGAQAFDGQNTFTLPGIPVPAVDVTGAGDTFGGALVFGLSHGMDLAAALALSLAASARAVTVEGPQGGVASLATVRLFAAEHGRAMA